MNIKKWLPLDFIYEPPDYYKNTSIKVQPVDPNRLMIVNAIRSERGFFAWDGSYFILYGTTNSSIMHQASQKGKVCFQTDLLLITDWDWEVLDIARIYVWDEI